VARTRYVWCGRARLCVVCLQRSFGGALGEPPEQSAAPPVPAHRRRRSISSCETGYDGQTSGYQRVDDDDVNSAAAAVAASVEEETDGPMPLPSSSAATI